MSNRLDWEREERLQPIRIQHAVAALTRLGIEVEQVDHAQVQFMHRDHVVRFWPYSGWHAGATIQDGRGLAHLLPQLEKDPLPEKEAHPMLTG